MTKAVHSFLILLQRSPESGRAGRPEEQKTYMPHMERLQKEV